MSTQTNSTDRTEMLFRICSKRFPLAAVLFCLLASVAGQSAAQPVETHGVVTQKDGSQVVVQLDSSVALPDSATGRIYPESVEETSAAASMTVQSVSGTLVIARVTAPPQQGTVQPEQRVAFPALQRKMAERAQGAVNIGSTPPEVSVHLVGSGTSDGRELGTTPVITKLPAGEHRLRFRKSGHMPLERVVTVAADSIQSVRVNLQELRQSTFAKKGTLVVRPRPSKARVFVDGSDAGTGRVDTMVAEGEHEIRVSASGYQTTAQDVTVAAGERQDVRMSLSPETGRLRVTSSPEEAVVFIDGKEVGRTPLTTERPAGQDSVLVDKPGYQSESRAVSISGGSTQNVDVQLRLPLQVEPGAHSESAVRNVQVEREGERLHIQYDLSQGQGPFEVTAEYSSDGGETYEDIPESYLSGDVGEDVSAGPGKEIRWAALRQYSGGITGNQNRIRIVADVAENDRYPARPGVLVEFQYTGGGFEFENSSGETIAGASVGGMRARLGYEFDGATLALRLQKSGVSTLSGSVDGTSHLTSTASTWAFGPEVGALIVDQSSSWPIGIYSGQSYLYSQAEYASGLGYAIQSTTHRLLTDLRAYHAFSLSRTFDIVPEIRYTATDFSVTKVEAEGYSRTTTGFSSGGLRGALGFFIGTNDFGIHLAGTTNFVFYAVRAELRF